MKLIACSLVFALVAPTLAQPAARVLLETASPIVALAYAPDGQTLASADQAHRVTLTEVSSGKTRQSFAYKSEVTALAFSPDGTRLAIGVGKQIRILNPKSDMKTAMPMLVLDAVMPVGSALQFSADGRTLLAVEGNQGGESEYAVELWNARNGQKIRPRQTRYAEIDRSALAPDGQSFVSSTQGLNLALFSVKTGQKIRDLSGDIPHSTGFYVHDFAFSPDGKWLAGTGGFMESSGNFTVWNAATGQVKWSRVIDDYGRAIAWAPDSSRVATGTSYDTSYDDPKHLHRPTGTPIWSANGQWQRSLQRVPGETNALAWSPDGKTLATGGKDGAVRLYNIG